MHNTYRLTKEREKYIEREERAVTADLLLLGEFNKEKKKTSAHYEHQMNFTHNIPVKYEGLTLGSKLKC